MANEAQIRTWNDENAKRWLSLRAPMTRQLEPFGDAALQALQPRQGEAALDVGCGFGETTLSLARRTGAALGLDVCAPFLEVAREEASHGARYLLADAQVHRFDEAFDLVFSRFGVMFFDDAAAAFRNLRSALRTGGRLAVAVWGPWQENEWVTVPLSVLRKQGVQAPDPSPGPGPFGLSDVPAFVRLLEGAGFQGVQAQRLALPFEADAALLSEMGPAAAFLRTAQAAPEVRARFVAGLTEALGGKAPRGVAFIVTARAA